MKPDMVSLLQQPETLATLLPFLLLLAACAYATVLAATALTRLLSRRAPRAKAEGHHPLSVKALLSAFPGVRPQRSVSEAHDAEPEKLSSDSAPVRTAQVVRFRDFLHAAKHKMAGGSLRPEDDKIKTSQDTPHTTHDRKTHSSR